MNVAEGFISLSDPSFCFSDEMASVTITDSVPTTMSAFDSYAELIFAQLDPDPNGTRGVLTEDGWTSSRNTGTWSDNRDAASEFLDADDLSFFI